MAESGMLELAQELLASSKAGKTEWQAYGSDAFKVDIPELVMIISRVGREYSLRLNNSDGVLLDRLYADPSYSTSLYSMLQELFELARQQALNVDDSIDKALQYLKRE